MKPKQTVQNRFAGIFSWISKRSLFVKIILLVIIFGVGYFGIKQLSSSKTNAVSYQTSQVEKGTLIVTVASSGQVSTANNVAVTTQSSGVVKKIYVKNDDIVKAGDVIMELEPDLIGGQRSSQAYASYLGAKNSLANAQASLYDSQSTLFTNWQKYMDLSQNGTYQNGDGSPNVQNRDQSQYIVTNDNWLSAEAKYKNQQLAITQAQISLNNSWLSYQEASPIIYAPISGRVVGLSYQVGTVLTSQSNTSGTATSQKIASIKTDAPPTVTVNMTEIDIPKIKIGQKVTVTLDAFPDKTFTGKIASIDTVGAVSSGVTSYAAIIELDTNDPGIFPNMSASANIITNVKDNVFLIPSSAIQTQNGNSTVQIMKNGQVQTVTVTVGLSNDTQTEIVSGLNEGDTVVTSSTNTGTARTTTQSQSPFSAFGGAGGARGGAAAAGGAAFRAVGR